MTAIAINTMTGLPFTDLIPTFDFTGKELGGAVSAADGQYPWNGQVYVVEDGALRYIWNNVDGQMEMPLEGI